MSFCEKVKEELYPLQKNYFTLQEKNISINECVKTIDELDEDIKAGLRGAFLYGGNINDPSKSYHLEISVKTETEADDLLALMRRLGFSPKVLERKNSYVVYIKDAAHIMQFLGVMGANEAVKAYENAREVRSMRGQVNRQVNCETANIARTVDTSLKQIAAIRKIESIKGISSLPANLQEMARIRLAYPDASLATLGEYLQPPVGKSGVNHRLRRIMDIADTLD